MRKSAGPTLRPKAYPTWSPRNAATKMPASRTQSGTPNDTSPASGKASAKVPAATIPAMNSSESPGRKNPISRPDSANTISSRRAKPPALSSSAGSSTEAASNIDVTAGTLAAGPPPAVSPRSRGGTQLRRDRQALPAFTVVVVDAGAAVSGTELPAGAPSAAAAWRTSVLASSTAAW